MRSYTQLVGFTAILSTILACTSQGRSPDPSGNTITETREVSSFTGVASSGSFEVFIAQNSTQSVKIEADENLMPQITTEVRHGKLYIGTKGRFHSWSPVRIYITLPELTSLAISGSGSITGQNDFKCGDLSLAVSGSGDIKMSADAKSTQAAISGSGTINLKGTTDDFSGRISGSGDFIGKDFSIGDATISIAGSGNCKIDVSGDLAASISGSGNVIYRGNPKSVDSSVSGSGRISKARQTFN